MVGLGLTAPMASMMLMHDGVAQTTAPSLQADQARRWRHAEAAVLAGAGAPQPALRRGTKDQEGARVFYEPLAGWDTEGNLVPVLAAEIPTRANGGVAADGKVVTWKLKHGVKWHDGKHFTADDVVFTWEYAGDPAASTSTSAIYKDIKVEKVDRTRCVSLPEATPFWAEPSWAPSA